MNTGNFLNSSKAGSGKGTNKYFEVVLLITTLSKDTARERERERGS